MSTMNEETFTVVLYARVSTDDKGQTNETQIRHMKEYCKRNNFIIADGGKAIYQDEQTGTNDRRSGLRELKGRISEGDIDFVVARNQDRISREKLEYENFLRYAKTFRVRVRYSDNSSTPETVDGVIMDSVQSGLAKADNMKRSSTTKAGMETAKLKGIHCGRYLAFCFSDDVVINRGRIMTDGPNRTVIQSVDTIMDFARQGMTMSSAARTIGVSPTTLRRAMRAKGLEAEYERICGETRAKGIGCKRVPDDGENTCKRVDAE